MSMPPPPIHSFFHSFRFTLTMNLNFRLSSRLKEWKEKKREGGRFLFLLWAYPLTLRPCRGADSPFPPLPPPLPQPPDIPSNKTLNMFSFLRNVTTWVWQSWKRGDKTNMCHADALTQNRHARRRCLICLFYILHSSTDGLSIDFDLFCLSLTLWACVCMWGGGCVTAILDSDLTSTGSLITCFFLKEVRNVTFLKPFHFKKQPQQRDSQSTGRRKINLRLNTRWNNFLTQFFFFFFFFALCSCSSLNSLVGNTIM